MRGEKISPLIFFLYIYSYVNVASTHQQIGEHYEQRKQRNSRTY
jgi:hypothetical protein